MTIDKAGNKKETISNVVNIQIVYLVDKVNVGDYVAYEAGKWSNTVATPNASSGNASFGGYASGNDKAQSVQGTTNGWRVLNKSGSGATGTVTLVSAGIPVMAYYGTSSETNMNSMYNALDNFASNNYLNATYASSARSVKKADKTNLESASTLVIGFSYWTKDMGHYIERASVSRKILYWIYMVFGI